MVHYAAFIPGMRMLRRNALCLTACVALVGAAASLVPVDRCRRGRSEQGHPLVLSHRRERVRSRPHLGSLFRHDPRGHFRAAAHLRLPRAAVEGRADGRRSDARGHRRRQDVDLQDHEGRPFRARSRVQGQEARAHGPGLRLFVHAVHGSEEPLALRVSARGQDRRPGRARRQGEADGQVRLRRQGAGNGSGRPVHAALPVEGDRLQLRLHRRARVARCRGARGDRSVRRRHDGTSGGHRRVPAQELDAALQDRARGQSRISRLRLGLPADGRSVGQDALRNDERPADAAGRPRRDQRSSRRRSRAGSRSSRRKSTT